MIVCSNSQLQVSFLCSQTAVSTSKTSYDMQTRPAIIKLTSRNSADRSQRFFTTGWRTAVGMLLWNMDIVVFPAAGTEFNHLGSCDMLVFINTWNLRGNYMLPTCLSTRYQRVSSHQEAVQPTRLWAITIRKMYLYDSIHKIYIWFLGVYIYYS